MKKRITVFVVFIMAMVLCLALTGCGQNTNKQGATTNESHPGENFDTGDSSIMDGTNNPGDIVQSDDDSYADDAAKDRDDSNGNDSANSSDANRNADGTYSWQVGGTTITTKINVMDYIDGNVWRANEMASALGWDPFAMKIDGSYNVSMKSKKPANYRSNGLVIYYSEAGSTCNGFSGHIQGEGGYLTFAVSFGANGDYLYRMNDADFYWTIDGIVCFAYAMENMPSNNDPFSGVLNGSNSSYSIQ